MIQYSIGIKASLHVHRDREVTLTVAEEYNYNYTNPIWHNLSKPVKVFPGNIFPTYI